MPFTNTCMGLFQEDNYKNLFEKIVEPLVETHTNLKYVDFLRFYEASEIKMDLIARMIQESSLVIAEVSEKNLNVFFEVGISYTYKKSIIFLCSLEKYNDLWKKKMPFDIEGRELIIYKDENELKIKLGRAISDSLYKTMATTVSWSSDYERNSMKSSRELEFIIPHDDSNEAKRFWSDKAIHSNFIIQYTVDVLEINPKHSYPDIRFLMSPKPGGVPLIAMIFPWENIEIDPQNKFECHIDFFKKYTHPQEATRFQQKQVCDIRGCPFQFKVFISFYYPNLVFESDLFEEKIIRLTVPISDFNNLDYPVHFNHYIGFESKDNVNISEIKIKEVFIN